jgi:elongator complex protein 3
MSIHSTDYTRSLKTLIPLLLEVIKQPERKKDEWLPLLRRYPSVDGRLFDKNTIIQAYRALAGTHGLPAFDPVLVQKIRQKPTRTQSGVAPVTVLTKPFPCPGQCIFCPNDIRMPKSYLADEPGAQRAERNSFDPYLQTYTVAHGPIILSLTKFGL